MQLPVKEHELKQFLASLPCAIKSDPGRVKALLIDALAQELPPLLRDRPKSDYMAVVATRVDHDRCLALIRESKVRLPGIDYEQVYSPSRPPRDRMPLFLLVNHTRAHAFACRTAVSG